MRVLLLSAFLLAPALAQTTHTTPVPPSPANVDRPFAGGLGRYQQWYSGASLAVGFTTPMRIEQLEFFAGTSQSANATTLDMEVRMSHGKSLGLTGTFDTNYHDTPVIVLPRQNVQLLAGAPGAVVMTIPLTTRFTWDHVRPVLVELRIYGNSRANQPFAYNNAGTTSSTATTARVYQAGSAGATSGQAQQGVGLVTRFTARPGVVLDYGYGCAGEGGFVPLNSSVNIPWPGIFWNLQLSRASSQRLCMMVLGASNTATSSNPPISLPTDLGTLIGMGPLNCSLLADPFVTFWATTVGGGPGAGVATIPIAMPTVTSYVGLSLYTQFFVADPLAPNGVLSASQGVWAIVAPVGG